MNSAEMIGIYEQILAVTAQMLEAAHAADWDGLIVLERQCRSLVERLKDLRADAHAVLEPKARKRKAEILRQVLADDAAIRDLTEPWMRNLQHLLKSAGHERRAHAAYRAGLTD